MVQRDTGCECASQTTTRRNIRYRIASDTCRFRETISPLVKIEPSSISSGTIELGLSCMRPAILIVNVMRGRRIHTCRKAEEPRCLVKGKRASLVAEIRVSRSMMMSFIRVGCCVDPLEWDTRYMRERLFAIYYSRSCEKPAAADVICLDSRLADFPLSLSFSGFLALFSFDLSCTTIEMILFRLLWLN